MTLYYSTDPSVPATYSRTHDNKGSYRGRSTLPSLFNYFYNLDKHVMTPKDFQKHWDKIPRAGFSAKEHALVLVALGKHTKAIGRKNPTLAKALLSHALGNFDTWQDSALKKLDSFNCITLSTVLMHSAGIGINLDRRFLEPLLDKVLIEDKRNSANIKWALAAHDSQSPHNEYRKAYDKLPSFDDFKNVIDLHQKQFRDAELWFKGKTQVASPDRSGIIGSGEQRLSNIFERAGLKKRSESHKLKRFRQAIDLRFTDGQNEVHIEDDGAPHFLYDFNRASGDMPYSGRDKFRNALIIKENPNVTILRHPYNVRMAIFKAHGGEAERADVYRQLFDLAVQSGSGVYRAFYDGSEASIRPFAESADGDLWTNSSPRLHAA